MRSGRGEHIAPVEGLRHRGEHDAVGDGDQGYPLGGEQAGYNDIGILTAPDGHSYSVAVMIKKTSVPLPTRMTLMNNVVRAVIVQHDMSFSPDAAR